MKVSKKKKSSELCSTPTDDQSDNRVKPIDVYHQMLEWFCLYKPRKNGYQIWQRDVIEKLKELLKI